MQTSVSLTPSQPRRRRSAFVPLCFGLFTLVLLAGYAFMGKGFAYVGIPPYGYVGELGLLLGIVTLCTEVYGRLWGSSVVWLLVAFMLWGVACTVPYVETYGIDALRDAVIWGYGIYALAVATAVLRLNAIETVVELYRRVLPAFLLFAPFAFFLFLLAVDLIPRWPWTAEVPVLYLKPGDLAVHYAGAFAFIVLGLSSAPLGAWWLITWVLGACSIAAVARGSLITIVIVATLVMVLRPALKYYYTVGVAFLCGVFVLLALTVFAPNGVDVGLSNHRVISVDQITSNFESIFSDDTNASLEGTKEWRERWWDEIIDYTIYGKYFWTGKGFGINLADDDGFAVDNYHDLRNPHSAHMTILARMGVPGLLLWSALQIAFGLKLFLKLQRDRRAGRSELAAVEFWVLLYWLAFIVNGSVDVFLEGPQGGIWFWSVIGFGLALMLTRDLGHQSSGNVVRQGASARVK